MTRLEQLAALAARVEPLRVYATQDPSVTTEVARVVKDSDAELLAASYNTLPALVACVQVLARIDARRQAGKHTTLVSDRKAMDAALRALG